MAQTECLQVRCCRSPRPLELFVIRLLARIGRNLDSLLHLSALNDGSMVSQSVSVETCRKADLLDHCRRARTTPCQAVLFTCEEERARARGVFVGHQYQERVVMYGTAYPHG